MGLSRRTERTHARPPAAGGDRNGFWKLAAPDARPRRLATVGIRRNDSNHCPASGLRERQQLHGDISKNTGKAAGPISLRSANRSRGHRAQGFTRLSPRWLARGALIFSGMQTNGEPKPLALDFSITNIQLY